MKSKKTAAQLDAEIAAERRTHYSALGRRVVLDAPGGRGWR